MHVRAARFLFSPLWHHSAIPFSLGQVMLCEAAKGNEFGRVELGMVGLCRVRLPKETCSYRLGRVGSGRLVSCEAAQGNMLVWVCSIHVLMALKETHSSYVMRVPSEIMHSGGSGRVV